MSCKWALFSVLTCLCQVATAEVQARLCVTSDSAKAKCDEMKTAFDNNDLKQLSCVQALNQYGCMRMIKSGDADIMKVDDTDIFAAGRFFGLIPILRESSSANPEYLYRAVIVVRSDAGITSLDSLHQKKSCHTGVGRTVGWTVPVSNLQAKKIMDIIDCDNTVKNVAAFFSKSCAPGAYSEINNIDGDNPENICEICDQNKCPSDEKYAGYSGAVQCLLDGHGEVAFAKATTIGDLAKTNTAIRKEDFRLLCPDGSLRHVDESATCFWATRPTDVMVTSPTLPSNSISELRDIFERGSRLFGTNSTGFKMFSSDALFTSGTEELKGVTERNYSSYLGSGYLNTMVNYIACPITERWCVISQAEQDKCTEMSAALASARITNNLSCVKAKNHKECMEKIQNGTADLVTLDGGDVYTGGKSHNLVPIMAESYGVTNSTSYWAVAVVKKSNKDVNINNLKGKTSCHTGIYKTSGWNIPIGTLIEKGSIPSSEDRCGIVKAVGAFFSQSCVPGALDSKYDPSSSNPSNLCELCGGKQFCQRDSSNKYYSYKGAFRCLVEKDADVAFVKHTTVTEYTDGKLQEDWAKDLKSSDFELLCLDGSRKPIDQWQRCSLAGVPSHAVVTSSKKSIRDRHHYITILKKAQLVYGQSSSGFKMFSTSNGNDAIFDDATSVLTEIMSDEQDYKKWLGKEYLDAVSAIDKKVCTAGATGPSVFITYVLMFAFLSCKAMC